MNKCIIWKKMKTSNKTIQFIKVLGTGGYGKVWLITYIAQKPGMYNQNEPIYTEVSEACKVLQLQRNDKPPTITAANKYCPIFLNLRYLKHENIVQMLDLITIPDTKTNFLLRRSWCLWSYATEIWWTSSTSTIGRTFVWRDVQTLVQTNLERSGVFANQCVVHLDIKPANIFYKFHTPGLDFSSCTSVRDIENCILDSTFKLGDLGLAISYNREEQWSHKWKV